MVGKKAHSNVRLLNMYNKRARRFGEAYLRKHYWRIKAMYGVEDVEQDALEVYIRIYRRHARKGRRWTPEGDLFLVYKRAIWGRVNNRSRQCFPNSHAYVAGQGKLVLDIEDVPLTTTNELESCLASFSSALSSLPRELAEALTLLIRDFFGTPCIEQRKVRRLSGEPRQEPLQKALARQVNVDPSRDLIKELAVALGIKNYQ